MSASRPRRGLGDRLESDPRQGHGRHLDHLGLVGEREALREAVEGRHVEEDGGVGARRGGSSGFDDDVSHRGAEETDGAHAYNYHPVSKNSPGNFGRGD